MKIKTPIIALVLLVLFSCEFNKSVSQDLMTGMTTRGDGLSCEDVSLSNDEQKLNRNTFIYGEKFYLDFENIEGFIKEEDYVFPGMQLSVLSQSGDTVLNNDDLYSSFADGINISPLLLQAKVVAAQPIHSNNNYTLHINIWDKKGEGTFNTKMDFDVIPNDQIKVDSKGVSFDEIYLFSQERGIAITDVNARFNENIFMIFEGLEGFKEEDGSVYPGLSILAKDAEGEIILDEQDLMAESSADPSQLKDQIAPSFIFEGSDIKNPITCEIVIWDKKGENRIAASVELNIE